MSGREDEGDLLEEYRAPPYALRVAVDGLCVRQLGFGEPARPEERVPYVLVLRGLGAAPQLPLDPGPVTLRAAWRGVRGRLGHSQGDF